jgi:hypothetical protein
MKITELQQYLILTCLCLSGLAIIYVFATLLFRAITA